MALTGGIESMAQVVIASGSFPDGAVGVWVHSNMNSQLEQIAECLEEEQEWLSVESAMLGGDIVSGSFSLYQSSEQCCGGWGVGQREVLGRRQVGSYKPGQGCLCRCLVTVGWLCMEKGIGCRCIMGNQQKQNHERERINQREMAKLQRAQAARAYNGSPLICSVVGGKVKEKERTESSNAQTQILKCQRTNRSNTQWTHPVRQKQINPNVHGSSAMGTY